MTTKPNPVTEKIDSALKAFAEEEGLSIRINGICMQPLIMDGALVSVRKQAIYWPGDILVKRCASGQLVAHRLIGFYLRKGNLNFVTRADNADKADSALASAQIIGRVAGGECAKQVMSVPIRSRIKALGQFSILAVNRLGHRLASK